MSILKLPLDFLVYIVCVPKFHIAEEDTATH